MNMIPFFRLDFSITSPTFRAAILTLASFFEELSYERRHIRLLQSVLHSQIHLEYLLSHAKSSTDDGPAKIEYAKTQLRIMLQIIMVLTIQLPNIDRLREQSV